MRTAVFLIVAIIWMCGLPWWALSAPIDDLQIMVSSSDICDAILSQEQKRPKVYAVNNNVSDVINLNYSYDSDPAGAHFSLLDSFFAPLTENFPKQKEIRIPPGGRVQIGCASIYRSNGNAGSYFAVPLQYAKAGASVVDPGAPVPPENFRDFTAFFTQRLAHPSGSGCPSGKLYFVANMHPYKRLALRIQYIQDSHPVGEIDTELPPLSNTRLTCTNGPSHIGQVIDGSLSYPFLTKVCHISILSAICRRSWFIERK